MSQKIATNKKLNLIEGLSLEEWIDKETAPRTVSLCGHEYPNFKPYLCETILGDGLQLVYFRDDK